MRKGPGTGFAINTNVAKDTPLTVFGRTPEGARPADTGSPRPTRGPGVLIARSARTAYGTLTPTVAMRSGAMLTPSR